jgi:dTDP-glucose pyrophosphorylase
MIEIKKHIVQSTDSILSALKQLNTLGSELTLFVVNAKDELIGTLTDGDIRRGFLNQASTNDLVSEVMNPSFKSLILGKFSLSDIELLRNKNVNLLPIIDESNRIIRIINLATQRSLLPIDAIIMAGGEGKRLRPLTEKTPKPLLKIGNKPILEHNIDRLALYGVENIHISINYLGHLITDYFKDGSSKNIRIHYVNEDKPLGTIGAASNINSLQYKDILVMNSDLLTNIDFEDFYKEFLSKSADMAIASIPYTITIPYAVLETENERIVSFKEKPSYTYYSSAGIYLIKKEALALIPKNAFFNATDLIDLLLSMNKKVIYYPLLGYWLDIGKHEDYLKAQDDIKHIQL